MIPLVAPTTYHDLPVPVAVPSVDHIRAAVQERLDEGDWIQDVMFWKQTVWDGEQWVVPVASVAVWRGR